MKLYYSKFQVKDATYYVASTKKGLAFVGSPNQTLKEVNQFYQAIELIEDEKPNIEAVRQIKEYLENRRQEFNLAIDLSNGTQFQQKIWKTLTKITYGRGVNYTELAELAETPKAIRAVASAVARNPILLVIPCHRVIRKDGKIGNYRAGVELKEKLLKMEGFLKD